MTTIDNGGPAFAAGAALQESASLRDWFAVHASDKDIESLLISVPLCTKNDCPPDNWRQIARYMHADAMLAARKPNPNQ